MGCQGDALLCLMEPCQDVRAQKIMKADCKTICDASGVRSLAWQHRFDMHLNMQIVPNMTGGYFNVKKVPEKYVRYFLIGNVPSGRSRMTSKCIPDQFQTNPGPSHKIVHIKNTPNRSKSTRITN